MLPDINPMTNDDGLHPHRTLQVKITNANTSVMLLAATTGVLPIMMPYTSHNTTPTVNSRYIIREMARVSRVFKICQTCGTKDAVVHTAAKKPRISVGDMGAPAVRDYLSW